MTETSNSGSFALVGFVDDEPVFAVGHNDQVTCAGRLLARARVVVALGETFDYHGTTVAAEIGSSIIGTFLTMMRACDTVAVARLDLPTRDSPNAGIPPSFRYDAN